MIIHQGNAVSPQWDIITVRYHHTSTGMAKLKNKQKIWQGCETTGTRILWVEMQSEKVTLENSLATSCE